MQELSRYSELGRPLTAAEVDGNWDAISEAVESLENGSVSIVGINLVENESGAFLDFIDGDGASVALIPFPAGLQQAGAWISGASYTTRDIVTFQGGTFLCSVAHTATGTEIWTDLDLGRWLQLGSSGATAIAFQAGGSGMVSDTVQDAIIELFGMISGDSLVAVNVTYDNTGSGLAAENVQAALDEIAQAVSGIQDTDDQTATQVPFTPPSGMTATNVQTAIEEVKGLIVSGGGGPDDQTAAEVPFTPASGISATNVQAAIVQVKGMINDDQAASEVPFTPASGISATNVQAAIVEIKGLVDSAGGTVSAADVTVDPAIWTQISGSTVQGALDMTDQTLADLRADVDGTVTAYEVDWDGQSVAAALADLRGDVDGLATVTAYEVDWDGQTVAAALGNIDNRFTALSSAEINHSGESVQAVLISILARLDALESA